MADQQTSSAPPDFEQLKQDLESLIRRIDESAREFDEDQLRWGKEQYSSEKANELPEELKNKQRALKHLRDRLYDDTMDYHTNTQRLRRQLDASALIELTTIDLDTLVWLHGPGEKALYWLRAWECALKTVEEWRSSNGTLGSVEGKDEECHEDWANT